MVISRSKSLLITERPYITHYLESIQQKAKILPDVPISSIIIALGPIIFLENWRNRMTHRAFASSPTSVNTNFASALGRKLREKGIFKDFIMQIIFSVMNDYFVHPVSSAIIRL